jgi:Ca2+-transporting ATPase
MGMSKESTPEGFLDYSECLMTLGTNPDGLTPEEVAKRLEEHGRNELQVKKRESPISIFLSQFRSPLVYVLILAATVSILVDHATDAVVIAIILLINATIGFVQEWKAERTIESIKQLIEQRSLVIRAGEEVEIPSVELVPGDLLLLRAGEKVPADGRVLFESNLHVDESLLTGESVPIKKDVFCAVENPHYYEESNKVFAGSYVTEGRARILVQATGDNTTLGEINKELSSVAKKETTIMIRLKRLSLFFLVAAMFFLVLTVVLGLYRSIPIVELFLFSLSALVSAIPEGLIAIVTIVLSVGVYKLSQKNVIVRNLGVVETLGLVNVICSDKTGTLTKNQMMTRRIFTPNHLFEVSGSGFNVESGGIYLAGCGPAGCLPSPGIEEEEASSGEPIRDDALKEYSDLERVLTMMALCNDSDVYSECLMEEDPERICTGENRAWRIRGSPTEAALLVALEKAGLHKYVLDEAWPRVSEIPFNSERKFMATLHRPNSLISSDEEGNLLIVKGAPEVIEEFLAAPSNTQDVVTEFASQGLRVLGCAVAAVPSNKTQITDEDLREMTFVGLCGINDPPREGVRDYIEKANNAGIDVIMITGDNAFTAKAIGQEVGIFVEERGDQTLTGDQIDALDDQQLQDALTHGATVLSRTSPIHKLRVVEALQSLDKLVSMTGDGVNDSPALRQANVGIAMGVTGTDIAKEASDIVLQDERFESVVDGIEEGRNILTSLRRVVLFLTSTNLAESFTIIGVLLLFANPILLLPIQILWVNLVTDGMLDIALSLEPKERGLLDQQPGSLKDRILSWETLSRALFYGLIMSSLVVIIYYQNLGFPEDKIRTMMFITLIVVQWFSVQNCRSPTKSVREMGLFRNRYILVVYVVDIMLVGILFVVPALAGIFRLVPLAWYEWLEVVMFGALVIILEETRKAAANRLRKN